MDSPRSGAEFRVDSRVVFSIALPMTLAFLTTPLIGVVDLAVVGQLGDAAIIGGIAVGALIFDVIFSTFNFLRSGTTGLTAQAYGAGDRREIDVTLLRALLLAVICGLAVVLLMRPMFAAAIAFLDPSPAVADAASRYYFIRLLAAPFTLANYALLGWVLGLGRPVTGLLLQTWLNGLNILLSFYLGLECGWGIEGVAWAAVIAELSAIVVGLLVAFRIGRGGWRKAMPHVAAWQPILRMLAVNRDIMIRSFALLGAFAMFTRTGAGFGDATLAGNAVLMNFFLVGGYFLDGLATAAEQLAGRALGAGRAPQFRTAVRLTLVWGYVFSAAVALCLMLAGPWLIRTMATAEDVRAAALLYLPYAALTPLVGVLAFEMDGVYIGATWSRDMRNMMLLSLTLYLAALAVLVPVLGNHGLWLCLLLFLGLRGISLLSRLPRLTAAAFAPAGRNTSDGNE